MQGRDGQPDLVSFPLPHPAFLAVEPSRFLMERQPCQLQAQRSGGVSFLRIMRSERAIWDGRQTDRQTDKTSPSSCTSIHWSLSKAPPSAHSGSHTYLPVCIYTGFCKASFVPASPHPTPEDTHIHILLGLTAISSLSLSPLPLLSGASCLAAART